MTKWFMLLFLFLGLQFNFGQQKLSSANSKKIDSLTTIVSNLEQKQAFLETKQKDVFDQAIKSYERTQLILNIFMAIVGVLITFLAGTFFWERHKTGEWAERILKDADNRWDLQKEQHKLSLEEITSNVCNNAHTQIELMAKIETDKHISTIIERNKEESQNFMTFISERKKEAVDDFGQKLDNHKNDIITAIKVQIQEMLHDKGTSEQ